MAIEKFNAKPHHDNPNHAGRHSHEMRKQAADYELASYLNTVPIPEFFDLLAQIYDWDGQMDRLRQRGSLLDNPTETGDNNSSR